MNNDNVRKITIPANTKSLLHKVLTAVNDNEEIATLWQVINVNAIDRLGMSDHGSVHFQIVSNIALKLHRMLLKKGIVPSIVKDFGLTNDHAEVVILLARLLHDTGMSINRDGHEEFSLILTNSLLRETLSFIPVRERTIVISETLHAIYNHRSGGKPITIEGGIVRVADALDMTQGRTRVPFEAGIVDIYSLSAFAVDKVEILEGTQKPIEIMITMNNSAGLFQVDELLKSKLRDSGIEDYISVKAVIEEQTEKKLISTFEI